ncbi:arylesterase [Sphingobium sp. AN558]|uniref:arylesterase n=1 Tax=Sphingobium sp. AN558 TaxID=3133442 RepID=UPI0030C26C02
MKKGTSLGHGMKAYGALALLLQLASACSPSAPQQQDARKGTNAAAASAMPKPSTAPAADQKLIVAFGDSLFAGYGLAQGEGFAPALERALVAQGLKARVFNAGVSGDTSGAARERLAFTLGGLPRKPDLMIVGLGGNDLLRGLDPGSTRANLDAILRELKKRDIPVMLTGMVAAPNMGPDYAKAFNPIYPDLAKRYDAPLYPFILDGVIGHRALLLPDGMHPNPSGVGVMIGHVAPIVAAQLKG